MLTVAITGRTNVGKSTLFNRILGQPKALTSEIPHTTRDRNTGRTVWRGVPLTITDTGGIDDAERSPRRRAAGTIDIAIRNQAAEALAAADVLLLVLDMRDGVLPSDRALGRYLHSLGRPVIVVCNKAETPTGRRRAIDAAELGFGDPAIVSALTGMGVGDLLDRVTLDVGRSALDAHGMTRDARGDSSGVERSPERPAPSVVRIAIVGEPNVGKSSLVNAILGREEVIVRPEPFTTRDVHDVDVMVDGRTVTLLDTAGIRRLAMRHAKRARSRLEAIERMAVSRGLDALARADVAILVLDATRPLTHHSKQLASAIVDAQRAAVIVVNKVDLLPSSSAAIDARIRALLPHCSWAPIIRTSATVGAGVAALLPAALRAAAAGKRMLTHDELAAAYRAAVRRIPKPKDREGMRNIRMVELQQVGAAPPVFLLRTRRRVRLPAAIPNIVERTLREQFDFAGTPITIAVRSTK